MITSAFKNLQDSLRMAQLATPGHFHIVSLENPKQGLTAWEPALTIWLCHTVQPVGCKMKHTAHMCGMQQACFKQLTKIKIKNQTKKKVLIVFFCHLVAMVEIGNLIGPAWNNVMNRILQLLRSVSQSVSSWDHTQASMGKAFSTGSLQSRHIVRVHKSVGLQGEEEPLAWAAISQLWKATER